MSRFVTLALLVLAASPGLAQEKKGSNYALLVSCGEKYNKAQLHPLPKSFRDMDDYRKALLATGFDADNIVFLHDRTDMPERFLPEKDKIIKELKLLLDGVEARDTVVVALNGHGLHFKGDKTSYFCPLNAKVGDKSTLIPMDGDGGLFPILKTCKAKRKLLVVGACRNDPAKTSQAAETIDLDLFDPDEVPEGIAALYSCRTGQKTYFEEKQDRSYFFDHLVRAWQGEYHPGEEQLTLEAIFDKVKEKTTASVRKEYGESQVPEVRREYRGEWLVARAKTAGRPMPEKPTPGQPMSVESPDGAKAGDTRVFEIAAGVKMTFCWIPAGKTTLGSPADEESRGSDEKEHVFETKGFWLGKYEVTQEEWQAVMENNPSKFKGAKLPVEQVRWLDCQKFIEKCAVKGMKLKLPHEHEWEYAARGGKGNKTAFYWGDALNGDKANCNGNTPFGSAVGVYKGETTEVGSYAKAAPHPWGLCDIIGNVAEWCENSPPGIPFMHEFRGGSWSDYGKYCRTAYRVRYEGTVKYPYLGFRLALVP